MDSLAQLFEIVVLASTGFSVAALVGFIVWDSIIDSRQRRPSATIGQLRTDGIRLASGMNQAFTADVQTGAAKAA